MRRSRLHDEPRMRIRLRDSSTHASFSTATTQHFVGADSRHRLSPCFVASDLRGHDPHSGTAGWPWFLRGVDSAPRQGRRLSARCRKQLMSSRHPFQRPQSLLAPTSRWRGRGLSELARHDDSGSRWPQPRQRVPPFFSPWCRDHFRPGHRRAGVLRAPRHCGAPRRLRVRRLDSLYDGHCLGSGTLHTPFSAATTRPRHQASTAASCPLGLLTGFRRWHHRLLHICFGCDCRHALQLPLWQHARIS